jgi:hypothetical protein
VLTPAGAHAALPPFWQSAREITTIVNDERVHGALKYEEPILSVGLTAPDTYELRTERCTLQVRIVDKPATPGVVGPRSFDIEVGGAACQ